MRFWQLAKFKWHLQNFTPIPHLMSLSLPPPWISLEMSGCNQDTLLYLVTDDRAGLIVFSPPYPLGNNRSFWILPFGERRQRERHTHKEMERETQLGEIMYFYERIKTGLILRKTDMGKELFLVLRSSVYIQTGVSDHWGAFCAIFLLCPLSGLPFCVPALKPPHTSKITQSPLLRTNKKSVKIWRGQKSFYFSEF